MTAGQDRPNDGAYRFDVAFSFPGEHRDYVRSVYQELCKSLGPHRLFFDERSQAELLGFRADVHLQDIYHNESELIAVFWCKEYAKRDWCGLEWDAIRDIIKQGRHRDVIPFRFDGAAIPGVYSNVIYANAGKMTPPDAAELICQRLRINREARGEEVPTTAEGERCGALHNMPSLPQHFQARQVVYDGLKKALLSPSGATMGLVGAGAQIGGIHGMGGVGKSVLAAALCHDGEVQKAFPDGLIWLTIGREASQVDITTRQLQLAHTFTDKAASFHDAQEGRAYLHDLLRDRACLIVLDDVWELAHATAFSVVGPRGRLLITTRDAGILRSLGAASHEIDKLDPDDALRMLADWAGRPVESLPPEAREVAQECGGLPLALAMIGAMVQRRPDSWENALRRLRSADLDKIRAQFPDYPYEDLLKAIQVSVEALDDASRGCYLDLAVFREDARIPEVALETLWGSRGQSEPDARDLIDRLVDLALLRRGADGRLSLHDLQMDYVRKQDLGDARGLHNALLSAYQGRCPNGWHTGPNDGYFFENLAYHLAQAGRAEELRTLLVDFDWIRAKLDATDVVPLLADYETSLSQNADNGVSLVRDAIRLSSHVLARDKAQLAGQLIGRFRPEHGPAIQRITEQIHQGQQAPWLCPLTPNLDPPGGPLLATLQGHTNRVTAVAVTPDGRRAISGADDNTLKVWDLQTHQELATLQGHTESVTAVAVTPDGRRAISGAYDNTLKVWDLQTHQELATLQGHTRSVTAVAVTPDGRRAISGAYDDTLKVWDLQTHQELATLEGHAGSVTAVAVTPDGRRAISGAQDNTLKVWDLQTHQELATLEGHAGSVTAVAVTPDGRRAISGAQDNTLKVWDLQTHQELASLKGHTSFVHAVAVTPDGRRAVSGAFDNTLKVWDLQTHQELASLQGHTNWVHAVAVTPDGRRAISGAYDNTLKVWDLQTHQELATLQGHTMPVTAVAVTPDGRRAISGAGDNTQKVWDLQTHQELASLKGLTSFVTAVAVTPDGRRAISGAGDNTLKVWDLQTHQELATLQGHTRSVTAVAVTPDGRRAISGAWDDTLKVWDLQTHQELATLQGHTNWVTAVAVTPDGRRAISGAYDDTLKVWDLQTHQELATLQGHTNSVHAVAVTPDGRRAISGAYDNTLKVWDLQTHQELATLQGHTNSVHAVAVTPDGRRAISGAWDHTLKVWDLADGHEVATFTAEGPVRACAVAPDNRTLIAGDDSGRVHFLRLQGVD